MSCEVIAQLPLSDQAGGDPVSTVGTVFSP